MRKVSNGLFYTMYSINTQTYEQQNNDTPVKQNECSNDDDDEDDHNEQ